LSTSFFLYDGRVFWQTATHEKKQFSFAGKGHNLARGEECLQPPNANESKRKLIMD
jgi:hypothetical protein